MTEMQSGESGRAMHAWQDHRAALVRFVRSRVSDDGAAEDIVHDVLLRAYAKAGMLRDEEKLESWLYQMTRNAIVDHYRSRRPSGELPEDLKAPEEERRAGEELAGCVAALVAHLPEHSRQAIELAELQGLTQKETAQRLGITLSGAKSRVQRARAQLQELILACCRIERDVRGGVIDYEPKRDCGTGCMPGSD